MRKYYLLTLILLSSLLFNFILVYLLHLSFIKLQLSRTFPVGQLNYSQAHTLKFDKSKTLVMLGDSRVQLWPTSLISSNLTIINKAIGGQTSSQLYYQVRRGVDSKFAFIQTCINDIHWIAFNQKDTKKIVQQCKNNISNILNLLHDNNQIVILSTIIPPGQPNIIRSFYWPNNIEDILKDINNFIHEQKDDKTIIFDNTNIKNTNSEYIQEKYIDPDFFLHLNEDAYITLSKHLDKILLQL